ncbi:MAG: lipopolysaccharide transport periplasmic protein LptA [Pseudomonadota bacterium]
MKKRSVLLLCASLISAAAWARTEDRNQRAEFRAGRSTENAGVVEFSRGFELTQGSLTITSDSARVFRDDKGALVRIEIIGKETEPARWREELDDGSPLDGRAERIDYFLQDEKVTLIGQAQVRKAGDEMRAETINYDLNTQQLDAGGNSDKPVLFIYTPPQKPADG